MYITNRFPLKPTAEIKHIIEQMEGYVFLGIMRVSLFEGTMFDLQGVGS